MVLACVLTDGVATSVTFLLVFIIATIVENVCTASATVVLDTLEMIVRFPSVHPIAVVMADVFTTLVFVSLVTRVLIVH